MEDVNDDITHDEIKVMYNNKIKLLTKTMKNNG